MVLLGFVPDPGVLALRVDREKDGRGKLNTGCDLDYRTLISPQGGLRPVVSAGRGPNAVAWRMVGY